MHFALEEGHNLCALPEKKRTIYGLFLERRHNVFALSGKKGTVYALCLVRLEGNKFGALPGKRGTIYALCLGKRAQFMRF